MRKGQTNRSDSTAVKINITSISVVYILILMEQLSLWCTDDWIRFYRERAAGLNTHTAIDLVITRMS